MHAVARAEGLTDNTRAGLLEVDDLSISFGRESHALQVVRNVSFSVGGGEIVGMVGESGSGKSLSALAIMRLLAEPPARVTGSIRFEGRDLLALSPAEMQDVRGSDITMVFQEPMTALDPVFTVGTQLAETVRAHRDVTRKQARQAAIDMLGAVGIPMPARRVDEYPHQMSGGMRQRVMVAMALICQPKLLIADEPTTAVDVTVQAQILELVRNLSSEMGTAVLFITHDLGVVAELCSRVVTLYAGEVVETGSVDGVLQRPRHPYTSALLGATPRIEARHEPLRPIPGRLPRPGRLPAGCVFHPRCAHCVERCEREPQELEPLDDGAGHVRCWRADELRLPGANR